MMLQRLVFAVGLLATAGGIALTPRVALNTRPQLRFAHAAPAPLGCAPSNFAPAARKLNVQFIDAMEKVGEEV